MLINLVDPVCLKSAYTYDEYVSVKKCSIGVNSTTLYLYYKTITEDPVDYTEFYKAIKNYFYYDKYICKHGIEFIYYVKASDADFEAFLINKRSQGFNDVISFIPAYNK